MKTGFPASQVNHPTDGPTIFAKLRNVLASLYPKEDEARIVVADAGIDGGQIAFDARAQTNWHNILAYVIRQGQFDTLLKCVLTDYPKNAALLTAYEQYQLFIGRYGYLDVPARPPGEIKIHISILWGLFKFSYVKRVILLIVIILIGYWASQNPTIQSLANRFFNKLLNPIKIEESIPSTPANLPTRVFTLTPIASPVVIVVPTATTLVPTATETEQAIPNQILTSVALTTTEDAITTLTAVKTPTPQDQLETPTLTFEMLIPTIPITNTPTTPISTALLETTPVPELVSTSSPTISVIPATPIPLPSSVGETWANPKDGAVYVIIPAGEFPMGEAQTQQTIYIDTFWIMKTEVTNEEYIHCIEAGACTEPSYKDYGLPDEDDIWNNAYNANRPINNVNWHQANDYAKWVGGRLPTEAEWEKACRGTAGYIYPWGDQVPNGQLFNDTDRTTPVDRYPEGASPYGALDMIGNVWEWTSTLSDFDYPYNATDGRENLSTRGRRVFRGGGYPDSASPCTTRGDNYEGYQIWNVGFRVVRNNTE